MHDGNNKNIFWSNGKSLQNTRTSLMCRHIMLSFATVGYMTFIETQLQCHFARQIRVGLANINIKYIHIFVMYSVCDRAQLEDYGKQLG